MVPVSFRPAAESAARRCVQSTGPSAAESARGSLRGLLFSPLPDNAKSFEGRDHAGSEMIVIRYSAFRARSRISRQRRLSTRDERKAGQLPRPRKAARTGTCLAPPDINRTKAPQKFSSSEIICFVLRTRLPPKRPVRSTNEGASAMRSRHSSPATLLFLLSALLLISATARADDDTTDDEYEEHARVLRVSLLKGEVSLQRAGGVEWERAQLNTPLVEGDTLSTGAVAGVAIQADSRNFVRVGGDSVLKVVTLRDEGIALSLSEGTVIVRLSKFDRDHEYFEVDAPKTTVAAEKTGQYRVDVDAGGVRVNVRGDGRARIYSETSGFELRNERTARLTYNSAEEGDWELSAAAPFDEWDNWNDEREHYLASRLR